MVACDQAILIPIKVEEVRKKEAEVAVEKTKDRRERMEEKIESIVIEVVVKVQKEVDGNIEDQKEMKSVMRVM